MTQETPKQTSETQKEPLNFHDELVHTVEVAGDWNADNLRDLSEEELKALIVQSTFDYQTATFSDLFRNNAVKNELRRRQLLKSRAEKPVEFDDNELVVVNQSSTYHQYFPQVLKTVIRSAQKYEATVAGVPAEIRRQMASMEGYTEIYMQELNKALDERMVLGNILTLAGHINLKLDPNSRPLSTEDIASLRVRLQKLLGDSKISRTAVDMLTNGASNSNPLDNLLAKVASKDDITEAILGNNLNQRIIDILGGKCGHGVPDEFTPMILELDLIRRQYDFVFSKESELSLDARLVRVKERMDILKDEHAAAERNHTEFSKVKVEEYDALRAQMDNRQGELDKLAVERSRLSNQIVFQTDNLAKYQIKMANITMTQNMFADLKDVPSLTSPKSEQTPDVVRQSINRNMEARGDFHLQTIGEFLEVVDNSVMDIDFGVRVEDMSNEAFRVFFHKMTHGIAGIVTLPVPQLGDLRLRDQFKNSITGDLDRALGWPPGVANFELLSDDQKANVREKARSVYQAILEFRYKHEVREDGTVHFGDTYVEKEEVVHLKETRNMLKDMPPASVFAQGIPEENPQGDRVIRADMDAFLASIKDKIAQKIPLTQEERNKGATMYMTLFAQLESDWGEIDPPSGFISEYAAYLGKIDANIGTHFATAAALRELSAKFFDWRDYLLAGAAVYFGAKIALKARSHFRGNASSAPRSRWQRPTQGPARGPIGPGRVVTETSENALLKMRYLTKERQLTQWLQNTKAGRWFSGLTAVRNSRVARGVGMTTKYGSAALIPALAAYNVYDTEQRARFVTDNDELRSHYRDDHWTTAGETAGLGLTLALTAGPQFILSGPILYAGSYRRGRAAVKADWLRDTEDWLSEYDSSGLMGKLRDTNVTNAVEAGGGGTLYPRIAYPFVGSKSQEKAVETIDEGQIGARRKMIEAYFKRNLLVPKGMKDAQIQKILDRKVQYMSLVTRGGFDIQRTSSFGDADLYAELLERKEALEKAGDPPLLSYFDEKGERQWLDLRKLTIGNGSREEILSLVTDYAQHIRPAEDIFLFNTLGEQARELKDARKSRERNAEVSSAVRFMLAYKLSHNIFKCDSEVAAIDWPGIDSPVTSGDTKSANVVRTYIAKKVNEKLDTIVPTVLKGNLTPEQYAQALKECTKILQELAVERDNGRAMEYYAKAAESLKGNLSAAQSPKSNPLVGIIPTPPEKSK